MKHNYLLLLLCSFAISFSNAQIVDIPDPVFKDLLLNGDSLSSIPALDTNNDGEIQVSEAQAYPYQYLEIVTSGNLGIIYDFTGLEALVNVIDLYCGIYGGTNLDLSPFQQLKYVSIYNSPINNLDVSQNIALKGISIHNGNLTTVDLSQNINLNSISFSDHQLTDIIFPNGVELIDLDVTNNQLTSLDLSPIYFINSNAAGYFGVSNNPLTEIIFGDVLIAGHFYCRNTLLSNLDLSQFAVSTLDVSGSYNMQYINAKNGGGQYDEHLQTLLASDCPNLEVVCVDSVDAVLNGNGWIDSIVPPQTILTTNCSTTGDNYNQVLGTITFDDENDGCDTNDAGMGSILVQTTDGTNTFSSSTYSNGFFQQAVIEGAYTVSLLSLPAYFSVAPVTQNITFTGYNNTETLDFCVTSTQTINDVNVTLIPTSQARPGFDATYTLVYKNVGTTTLSGDVTLEFDEAMQSFVSANPTEDASTVNTLNFIYSNLEPFESRAIDIVLNTFTPGTVDNGDILNLAATITPDSGDFTLNDNFYTLNQVVVNSFDPNDKQVLQGSEINSNQTSEYLDYLIRFQNTGTASAINVSVTDVLNDKLDWDTFQMVSTSHPYEVNITNGDFVQFVFDDINLPAEQDNEPASHGYIAFKIKPKADVVVGDVITGLANIYFDFNAPIITNTVSTEVVDEALSIQENLIDVSIKLYPNPVNNQFNIEVLNDTTINSVEVFDIAGKSLLTFNESETYNISKLTSGIYFVKVMTNKGEVNKQIVNK